VKAELDLRDYETGRKISDEHMEGLRITTSGFHGEWNETVHPKDRLH
jgi:hypothetical protein